MPSAPARPGSAHTPAARITRVHLACGAPRAHPSLLCQVPHPRHPPPASCSPPARRPRSLAAAAAPPSRFLTGPQGPSTLCKSCSFSDARGQDACGAGRAHQGRRRGRREAGSLLWPDSAATPDLLRWPLLGAGSKASVLFLGKQASDRLSGKGRLPCQKQTDCLVLCESDSHTTLYGRLSLCVLPHVQRLVAA